LINLILDIVTIKGEEDIILQAIRDGTAKAVSDRSFLSTRQLGMAAFTIEGNTPDNFVTGLHETPGSPASQCAHRSEMFGILAVILLTNEICSANQITEGHITAKCDG
jgi:hypothetical protein